jgi:hypothetical protein
MKQKEEVNFMGGKLLWTGLTLIVAVGKLWGGESVNIEFVGAVVMVIGLILMWMNK